MLDKKELHKLALQTQSIRTVLPHSAEQEHSSAIYLTSSFKFNSAEQAAARFNKSEPGTSMVVTLTPILMNLLLKYVV